MTTLSLIMGKSLALLDFDFAPMAPPLSVNWDKV
jgi:hypothetical protein